MKTMNVDLQKLKKDLEKKYVELRSKIPLLADEELIKNDNFKKCFLINNILSLFQNSNLSELEVLAMSFDFDINKIIEQLQIEMTLDSKSKDFKYSVNVKEDDDEPES